MGQDLPSHQTNQEKQYHNFCFKTFEKNPLKNQKPNLGLREPIGSIQLEFIV